jgi:hypothetical protein
MVKVKVINRVEEDFTKERSQDVRRVQRNYDPALHQFERAHEYTRAVNAAKLERMFAKPFIAALPHGDGITALARNPKLLNSLAAGAADGEVRVWDVALKRTLRRLVGHTAAVRGISYAHDGQSAVSCSTDCTVKLWSVPAAPFEAGEIQADAEPAFSYTGVVRPHVVWGMGGQGGPGHVSTSVSALSGPLGLCHLTSSSFPTVPNPHPTSRLRHHNISCREICVPGDRPQLGAAAVCHSGVGSRHLGPHTLRADALIHLGCGHSGGRAF